MTLSIIALQSMTERAIFVVMPDPAGYRPEGLLLPQVGENAVQIDLVYSRDDGAAQERACIINIRLQLGKAFGQAEHIGQVVLQLIAKGIIRLRGGIMRPLHLEQTVDVFHVQDIFRNYDVDQAGQ